ncbi:hypothetical protein cce_5051 [Crocosphaera subtropica ATCC 51142]|uniref:Uncharacterized protein n=1 Tax=Crocosphaera subtropica (strain ATCC 51142 / BH68) TaxID=43989 RepID=B1X2N6_CROS5|nr:hypothetical protein [Crocosphaera subtropica]ACB54397.1 hypothetical protein cce_5051 [Crocosphaera subtropica ATCC 51142]
MFEKKIEQLSKSDITYISKQINKLKEYKNNTEATHNCLWRIASNAELFSFDELDQKGILTSRQIEITWAFIRYFERRNQKSFLGYICRLVKFIIK